jgi:hypothetical protein
MNAVIDSSVRTHRALRCAYRSMQCGFAFLPLQPPPGFGFVFNLSPKIPGSNIFASGTSTPHFTHILLHSAPTGLSSGINTTVLTNVIVVFRQSGILNSCASQLSPLLDMNSPQRASLGRLTQVPFFQADSGGGKRICWTRLPRQCLGPPEPE